MIYSQITKIVSNLKLQNVGDGPSGKTLNIITATYQYFDEVKTIRSFKSQFDMKSRIHLKI